MTGGITDATVEEIKARIDLADLISSYGIAVRTAGSSKKACCPFHHEKTPSFNINESRGFYHCFGCGESGDAIKFVMKMEGLSFVESVKKLAEQVGVKIDAKEDPEAGRRARLLALLAEIAQFYHRCLDSSSEGELARRYLKERALGSEIQADYLIGYAPSGIVNILKWAEKYGYTSKELADAGIIKAPDSPDDLGYHRFGGRLMFSIRDKRGRVVGFSGRQLVASKNSGKYVNSPETLVFKKSNVLYGFDKAAAAITKTPNREVIVCEGQIDCIRLQTSGFPNAVAGQGTAFTGEHVRMLKRAADQVALVYDDDGAGHKATIKSARLCLAAELPVRVVSLPNGDDPDSFLRTHPPEAFRAMLDHAESIMSFQLRIERAKELKPDSVDAVNRITKELMTTIAACPGAILRASMTAEAAKLMDLPEVALREALTKLKPSPSTATAESAEHETEATDDDDARPLLGEDAASTVPPPKLEMAFCELLLANEISDDARTLDGMIGEFLPRQLFTHDFTWRFIEVWRAQVSQGGDLIAPWTNTLEARERTWFDAFLSGQTKDLESSEQMLKIAEDLIRRLWSAYLQRIQGGLPAATEGEALKLRLKISSHVKQLAMTGWGNVKDLIRDWQRTPQFGVSDQSSVG